ncbi:Protein of unknown function DUF760 [Macleaya cordata]|uniref:UV-B-induced protein n=1 Tax=Macleaya cordata TaxID=56857 RepID=A0A200Q5F0_MACCD|nr:Protein of unknown function DUF760 [Macleaya cordata]
MDCCASYKTIPIVEALPAVVKSERGDRKFVFAQFGFSDSSRKSSLSSQGALKICGALRAQPFLVASARADSSPCNFTGVGTPLEPRSSAGKFLSGILQNQRHLFHFAVAEQLDELAADRDGAVARKNQSLGSSESSLHRRIAEMKEHECQIAIEDVMYMSIVHKFSDLKVPMVPKISTCITNGRLQIWPSKDGELESIHSMEVQEMIKEHLSTILGWRWRSSTTGNKITYQTGRLQLGRVYAASIMYGYFLKSACLRHQLESSLALTYEDFASLVFSEYVPQGLKNVAVHGQATESRSTSLCQESRGGKKAGNLRNYVMGFDSETLQRCAKLKSQEAVNLIEKHTWALFGDEKTGDIEIDEMVVVTNSSMKRLVLEAAAFGSFLWDVEQYVDSVYRLKEN